MTVQPPQEPDMKQQFDAVLEETIAGLEEPAPVVPAWDPRKLYALRQRLDERLPYLGPGSALRAMHRELPRRLRPIQKAQRQLYASLRRRYIWRRYRTLFLVLFAFVILAALAALAWMYRDALLRMAQGSVDAVTRLLRDLFRQTSSGGQP